MVSVFVEFGVENIKLLLWPLESRFYKWGIKNTWVVIYFTKIYKFICIKNFIWLTTNIICHICLTIIFVFAVIIILFAFLLLRLVLVLGLQDIMIFSYCV